MPNYFLYAVNAGVKLGQVKPRRVCAGCYGTDGLRRFRFNKNMSKLRIFVLPIKCADNGPKEYRSGQTDARTERIRARSNRWLELDGSCTGTTPASSQTPKSRCLGTPNSGLCSNTPLQCGVVLCIPASPSIPDIRANLNQIQVC